MKEKILSLTKYLFFALFLGVVFFSVKDTFCDIHAVETKNKNGEILYYVVFWDDASFNKFQNDLFVPYGSLYDGVYYSAQDAVSIYPQYKTTDDVKNYVRSDILKAVKFLNFTAEEQTVWASKLETSKIYYYKGIEKEIVEGGYGFYMDDANFKRTEVTNESLEYDWQQTNGYRKLLEVTAKGGFTVPEKYDEYVNAVMKDFRNFSIILANEKKDSVKNTGVLGKQRLQEFCLRVGFDREICYGLLDYVINYGDSSTAELKQQITNLNNRDSENIEDYVNKTTLTEYNSTNKPFYYFIYSFYQMDVDNNNLSNQNFKDIYGYYMGLMGTYNTGTALMSSGGLGIGLGNAFLTVLSESTDELAEKVIVTIAHDFSWGLLELLEKTGESISMFTPSVEQYLKYFGGIGISDYKYNADSSSMRQLFDLNRLFYYLGAVLLVLLALIQLVKIIVSPEQAETDWKTLLARFIVLAVFISQGQVIIQYIFDFTNKVWDFCVNHTDFADEYMDRRIIYKAVHLVTYDYFGIDWTYDVMGVIFNCAIGFIIIKNAFMLLAECIERYIVAVMLYFTFPTAISLGVSNSTSKVTASYFRMLGTQLFMLFMNLYFIRGFVILLDNQSVWANSLYGLIFVVAYLKVAQAFDSYLSSLGLSVAHTSGRMASELLGVGSTLLAGTMMLSRVGIGLARGIGRGATRGAGSALSNYAINGVNRDQGRMAKLFNLGENLRTGGLGGAMHGGKINANTFAGLESARVGRFGLSNASTLRSALNGGISGSVLNSMKNSSGQSLLNAFGNKVTRNGLMTTAQFSSLGGGGTWGGSVTTNGGRAMTVNGRFGLSDSQLSSKGGVSAMSVSRPLGVMQDGEILRSTISSNTGARVGDSFTLNHKDIGDLRLGNGEYSWTNAEIGLGMNLAYDDRVRANTLDLVANGRDLTFTKTYNGNIAVTDANDGSIIGFTSEHGDTWLPNKYETGYTLDDLNHGSLSNTLPTSTCEAVAIIQKEDLMNNTVQATPDFLNEYFKYAGEHGYEAQANKAMELQKETISAQEAYQGSLEDYVTAINTEGTPEREHFIEGMRENYDTDMDEIEHFMPNDVKDLLDIDKSFVGKDVLFEDAKFKTLFEQHEACVQAEEQFAEAVKEINEIYSHGEGDIVFYLDRGDNDRVYASTIHATTESESDKIHDAYTVIPLDIDNGAIAGTEESYYDRQHRRINEAPKNEG